MRSSVKQAMKTLIGRSIFRMIILWLARLALGRFFFYKIANPIRQLSLEPCGHTDRYAIEGSRTLVDDARAVLNGDADHLLRNNEFLSDVGGIQVIDPDTFEAVAPCLLDIGVIPQPDSENTTPYVSLPQFRTQVPVAAVILPAILPVNNQVQHANVTASRQCPYGCPSTFGRPGEYRRHMKKHNGPFFPCTVLHCNKVFYRQDKLNDHLNKGH